MRRTSQYGMLACICGLLIVLSATSSLAQDEPKNPINRFFNNLDKGIRGTDDETGRAGRDDFDVRTPQNPENSRRIVQAERFLKEGRTQDALEILQFLLNQPQDSLLMSGADWASLRQRVAKTLQELPQPAQRNYEGLYAVEARQVLDAAMLEADESALIAVLRRYPTLPAGVTAAETLVANWYQRGEFEVAAQLSRTLLDRQIDVSRSGVRAGYLAEQLDQHSEAEAILARAPGWQNAAGSSADQSPSDWLTANRHEVRLNGTTAGIQEPLLLPLWNEQRIGRFQIQDQIRLLLRDLTDGRRGILPRSEAVLAGDLVIARDLQGIRARDLATGRVVWQEMAEHDLESRLCAGKAAEFFPGEQENLIEEYQLAQLDHHPLTTAIFRDSVTPAMAVHAGRLYSVEHQDPLANINYSYYWQREVNASQPEWSVNELVCRDAATGRRLWALGGPLVEPLFSRPLANSYFFGPPTISGDELLVIAELDGEIYLHSIEPRSGEVLWSQIIASAGRPISEDPVRRMWSCRPTVTAGQILCPTSSGWLVSVNALTHELNWATRFPPRGNERRQRFRGGYNINSVQPINTRWLSHAPWVDGQHIVVAPTEFPDEFNLMQPSLFCLDLTGKILWQQQKSDSLYVAGIHNHQLILVGRSSMKALELEKGSPMWECRFPANLDLPSGTGVMRGNDYLLPLGGAHLLRIDLRSGEIQQTLKLAEPEFASLGNLLLNGDQLISASPLHVAMFPSVAVERDRWKELGPLAAERVLRETQMFLSQNDLENALEALGRVAVARRTGWTETQRAQARQLEWTIITSRLGTDEQEIPRWLSRLKELAKTTEELSVVRRYQAIQLQQTGDFVDAARMLVDLLITQGQERITLGTRTVRLDVWCGRRLAEIHAAAQEPVRGQFDRLLQQKLTELPRQDESLLERIALALGFHQVGNDLRLELIRNEIARGELSRATIHMRRIMLQGSSQQRTESLRLLAEAARNSGHIEQAIKLADELVLHLSEQPNSTELRSHWTTERTAIERQLPPPVRDWGAIWGSNPIAVDMLGGRQPRGTYQFYNAFQPDASAAAVSDSVFRFLYHRESRRLQIHNKRSGELEWSVPLRSLEDQYSQNSLSIMTEGTATLVTHQGIVHSLGIPDHEVLWQFAPDMREEGPRRLRTSMQSRRLNMQSPPQFVATSGQRSRNYNGYVMAADDNVVVLALREMVVLDALTGETLWTDQIPSGVYPVLLQDGFVEHSGQERTIRRRDALDGTDVDIPEGSVTAYTSEAIRMTGSEMVVLRMIPESSGKTYELASLRRDNGEFLWRLELPSTCQIAEIDLKTLGIMSPEGELSSVSILTGEQSVLGSIPREELGRGQAPYLLADASRVYLLSPQSRAVGIHIGMSSVNANGVLYTFARSGGLLWKLDTDTLIEPLPDPQPNAGAATPRPGLALALSDFELNPALTLLSERVERPDGLLYRTLQVIGIEKESGKVLFDWSRPSDKAGFYRMEFDQHRGLLELDSFSYRLRIHASEQPASN